MTTPMQQRGLVMYLQEEVLQSIFFLGQDSKDCKDIVISQPTERKLHMKYF